MPSKKLPKPNHLKDLALLFAIPIVIAIFAALMVYVPRLLAHPKYDFMYSICVDYGCKNDFNVDSSHHVTQGTTSRTDYDGTATLRYYDAKQDATRSLSLEEAKGYELSTSSKSPDGYSLVKEDPNRSFLFGGNSDSGWYLKNGAKNKKVELSNNDSYYSQDIKFLGWIKK